MATRESGDYVSVDVEVTKYFPISASVTIYWPVCGAAGRSLQMRIDSVSAAAVHQYTGTEVRDMSREEVIDAFAEVSLYRLLEIESVQGGCLEQYVDFDENGRVVVGRPYSMAEKKYSAFLEGLLGALSKELHIDHLMKSYPSRLGYLSYGAAQDIDKTSPFLERLEFDELALVLVDMLMQEGVVSYDFMIDVSDHMIPIRSVAVGLVWHFVDGNFPEYHGRDYGKAIPRQPSSHWEKHQYDFLAALDVPFVGYDEGLLEQLRERWK